MEVLATRDSWFVTECEAALLAEGVPVRWIEPWQAEGRGAVLLDVPTSEIERVSEIVSDIATEHYAKTMAPRARLERTGPLFLQPAFAGAFCLSVLLVVFFLLVGGSGTRSLLFTRGTMVTERFLHGDWWRIVTAATLHSDWEHALGNAGFLLVLGWAAAERLGSGMAVFLWLATAVGGFIASLLFGEATHTVGASGGLFGLLGAAGGHAVRTIGTVQFPWRARIRAFGAAFALLAYTAFSPESNIAAHVGGFITGLVFGLALPVQPLSALWQRLAAVLTAAVIFVAWQAASS